jgi:hypothetical protein
LELELQPELGLQLELGLGSTAAIDLEHLDRHLKCLQIEAEFTIDKALPTIVQKTKCHRFKSREIFSKSLQFLFDQLPRKICRVLEPRLLQLAKLANNP